MINENTSNVCIKALEVIVAVAIILMAATVLFASVNAEDDQIVIADGEEEGDEVFEWGDFMFKIESQENLTASIYWYIGNEKCISVPSSVQYDFKTYQITIIDEYAFDWCDAETITIPDGVTEIRNNAFTGCSNLKGIDIPSSVKTIGDYAFSDCEALTSIEIPSTVEKIGVGLFQYDANLTDVVLKNISEIPERMFYQCSSFSQIDIPASVGIIGAYAFAGTAITEISLPYSLVVIGENAFEGVPLSYLICPASLTAIADYAFSDCSSLGYVMFNDGLKSIGYCAFYGCTALCSVEFPDTVSEIGEGAFSGCTSIRSVMFGARTVFVPGMFNTSPIQMYTLSYNCNAYYVEDGILYSNNKLTLLAYPAMKTGDSFKVPADTHFIEDYAFFGNQHLTSVSGQSVIEVGEYAFAGCMNLKTVDFPNLKAIGPQAFFFCRALTNYEIPAGVDSIGMGAFIKSGVSSFTVSKDNQSFSVKDGVLYSDDLTTLVMYPERSDSSFTVPEDVYAIADGAFMYSSVKEVTFPSTLESIGENAFLLSSLEKVTIPSSVKTIGDYAFSATTYLQKVVFETSATELGTGIFAISTVSDVEFKDGVTTIGEYMFSLTLVSNIVLPESVKVIMCGAFSMINLDYIYIPAGALVHEDSFGWEWFVDAAGNELSYDELAGYAYKRNADGAMERQGYSVVSFDANGGSEPAPESITVANGFEVTLPDYKGVKEEYEFSGWYFDENVYAVGEKVKVESNMEFVAVWYKDIVSISFDITGGKADVASLKTEIGSSYTVNGNVMTISNGIVTKTVTVKGDYSSTAVVVWESASGNFIQDTVVKASFPQYTVTVMCDEEYGTVSAPATAFEGQTVKLTAEPKKGYMNTGWEEKDELVVIKDSKFVMPKSDVTIIGLFDVAYTITVKTATGGTAVADCETAAAGTIVTLTAYEGADYNFKYWEITPSVTVKDGKFIMPESNVTVTPVFSFAGTKTAEVENGKVVFDADRDIKEDTKITLTITKVKSPKQTNLPSDAVVYSIKATAINSGKTVDLTDKKATVTIFVDSKDAQKKVFYISEDGKTVENMNASYDVVDGGLVFSTTHFSDFAITEKNIDPIKDNTMMYIIIAAIILIIVIVVIIVAWRVKVNKARP